MAIPLVIGALLAGGTLVPHAAGGMIVSNAAGYIAGTYLSTAAIGGILGSLGVGTALTTAGVGAAVASSMGRSLLTKAAIPAAAETVATGAASTAAGSAVAALAAPVLLYAVTVGSLLTLSLKGYSIYLRKQLDKKIQAVEDGQEVEFTKLEAKMLEKILKQQAENLVTVQEPVLLNHTLLE